MSGSIRSAGVLQLHGWFLENVQRFSKEVDHEKDPCQLLHQVFSLCWCRIVEGIQAI